MWSSDYPHSETTFPHSHRVIEENFRGVPKDERDWAEHELKPDLRQRLAVLPVELVLVSHGEPVLQHGADALERALS